MKIVYLLYVLTSGGAIQTQRFDSDVACQQAAAFMLNQGLTAHCVQDVNMNADDR